MGRGVGSRSAARKARVRKQHAVGLLQQQVHALTAHNHSLVAELNRQIAQACPRRACVFDGTDACAGSRCLCAVQQGSL